MAALIASRTWEGRHRECPVCGQECWIEPSEPTGDAPCPACGHLLWFGAPSPLDRERASAPRPERPRIRTSLARRAGRLVANALRAARGRPGRRRPSQPVAAGAAVATRPSSQALWDEWLDGQR